jgi:hypothetical protein
MVFSRIAAYNSSAGIGARSVGADNLSIQRIIEIDKLRFIEVYITHVQNFYVAKNRILH